MVIILKKKDLRMKRVNTLLALFFFLTCCLLTGCSRPNTIDRSTLNNDFNYYTKALITGRSFTFNNGTDQGRKVSISNSQKEQVVNLKRDIDKRQGNLRKSTKLTQYPYRLLRYGDAVDQYLSLLKRQNVSNYTLINHFHFAARKGLVIVNNNLNGRPTNIFSTVIAADYTDGHHLLPKTQKPKSYRLTNFHSIKQRITQRFTLILLFVGSCIALLIIALVISQPSKQSDTMDALTESSDRSLFDQAKAKGTRLILQRLTLFSFIVLCGLLVFVNYYVRNN